MLSDLGIIERAKQGDGQAYGALVHRYERSVFAAVLSIIGDQHDAEDVTQEVFILGYRKLGHLRDSARFPYWLLRIARREAVRATNRQRRRPVVPLTADAPGPDRDGRLLDEDQEHLLWHIQRLPKHERLVVSLRYFDGHTMRQIAALTGRPIGTVTKQLSRATERLRHSLESEKP